MTQPQYHEVEERRRRKGNHQVLDATRQPDADRDEGEHRVHRIVETGSPPDGGHHSGQAKRQCETPLYEEQNQGYSYRESDECLRQRAPVLLGSPGPAVGPGKRHSHSSHQIRH